MHYGIWCLHNAIATKYQKQRQVALNVVLITPVQGNCFPADEFAVKQLLNKLHRHPTANVKSPMSADISLLNHTVP